MNDTKSVTFRAPDDMHIHLRQGSELKKYARRAAKVFARAVVMPNVKPPITTPAGLISYRNEIQRCTTGFQPLMTFKLVAGLNANQVAGLKDSGAVAGKYYPEGVTTNSEDGIRNTGELFPILEAMEEMDIILCVHGEKPGDPILTREQSFIPEFEQIVKKFPRLRIVFEHVSTKEAVAFVRNMPDSIAATVTVHHLLFTLEDMMASGFYPELYCKPVVKHASDMEAIRQAVLEGGSKFFFGSDSAPHPRAAKSKAPVASGVYSSPVALPLLIDFFDSHGALGKLEDFVSRFGAEFYRLPLNEGRSEWQRISDKVPRAIDGAIPLLAGKTVSWKKKAAG